MASSASSNLGNMVVVTHVVSGATTEQQQRLLERGLRFRKGQPAALGTVQVMIGVMVLVFGIAMATIEPAIGVFSGIFIWGSLIYIASGSVTVAAEKRLSSCLMIASLVLSIIAAIVAGIGVILYVLDGSIWYYRYARGYLKIFSIVLAVFQILQFIVSIVVAGYSCNAICRCCSEPYISTQTADRAFAAQAPPQFNPGPTAPAQPHPQVGPHYKSPGPSSTEPPAYELHNRQPDF